MISFLNKFTIAQTYVQCTVLQFTKGREETTLSAAHEACFCRMMQLLISDVTKPETNLIEDYF